MSESSSEKSDNKFKINSLTDLDLDARFLRFMDKLLSDIISPEIKGFLQETITEIYPKIKFNQEKKDE